MPNYYLDSSALVKRYRDEPGTHAVLDLLETAQRVVISRLTIIEVVAALVRRARQVDVPAQTIDEVFRILDVETKDRFEVIDIAVGIVSRSIDLVKQHALRAPDAIQLASALFAAGASARSADRFTFVCADRQLNDAAARQGLAIIDPTEVAGE